MTKKRAWTDLNRIPQEAIPEEFKGDGRYRPGGGYRCRKEGCGFVSKKGGFSGRQALRAHLKFHRRKDKAWRRPLIRQITWSAAAIIASALLRVSEFSLHEILPKEPYLPLGQISQPLSGVVIGTLLSVLLVSLLYSISPTYYPFPGRARLVLAGRISAAILMIMPIAWQIGLPQWPQHLAMPWLMWALGFSGLWLAVARGKMMYALSRRGQRSTEYGELFKPRNRGAKFDLMWWLRSKAMDAERARRMMSTKVSQTIQRNHQSGRRPGRGVVVDQGRVHKPKKDHK